MSEAPKPALTEMQQVVLQHFVRGKSNPEIGEVMNISRLTVGAHLANIRTRFKKHGYRVNTPVRLLYAALKLGFVERAKPNNTEPAHVEKHGN